MRGRKRSLGDDRRPGRAKDRHIDPDQFLRASVEYGDLGDREAWLQHLHLVASCPECLRRVLHHFGYRSLEELEAIELSWAGLRQRRAEIEGQPLVAWLDTLAPEERRAQVQKDSRLQRAAVVQALLRRSKGLWAYEPRVALEWTGLATAIVPFLSQEDDHLGSPLCLQELVARTWAYHGNVCRILSELQTSAEAFRKAEGALGNPPYDELFEAEVLALKASLLRDLRRFEQALATIDEVIRLYGLYQEDHLQGVEFLTRAKIELEAGHPDAALADLQRAVPLIDADRDPRAAYCCTSVHLHLLCGTGHYPEAQALVPEARRRVEECGSSTDRLRVRWCEGLIAAGTGFSGVAGALFSEVREGFLREGNAYDAALVSLDLAGV